jgi:hypothetical protein
MNRIKCPCLTAIPARLVVAFPVRVQGQVGRRAGSGTVTGTSEDQALGVEITGNPVGTGVKTRMKTKSKGFYAILQKLAGRHFLRFEKTYFATFHGILWEVF